MVGVNIYPAVQCLDLYAYFDFERQQHVIIYQKHIIKHVIVSTNDYHRITKLTFRKQKTLHAQKSNNNKQTNICYKKHQYVFNNICKVSTHRNFSQHDDILSKLIGDIFEIIYLQIYHIYIYIYINPSLVYYIYTYKQPANRNIYFCNKKSTNF